MSGIPTPISGKTSVKSWRYRLARFISDLANPLLLQTLTITAAAYIAGIHEYELALIFISSFILLTLTPSIYVFFNASIGKFKNYDLPDRSSRIKTFIITFSSYLLFAVFLYLIIPQHFTYLIAILISIVLTSILAITITKFWKISMHTTSTSCAAGIFVALSIYFDSSLALLLASGIIAFLPIMIWSRVQLKIHTLQQTLAGTFLGPIISIIFLLFLY